MQQQQTSLEKARVVVAERARTGQGTATPERLVMAGADGVELVGRENTQRIISPPLDRLWAAGAISLREYVAGDQYRVDVYLANVDPGAPSIDWGAVRNSFGPRFPSMFSSQVIADARIRWRTTQKAIRGIVRTVVDLALVKETPLVVIGRNVFCRNDMREATIAGQSGLQVALGSLADYYGM